MTIQWNFSASALCIHPIMKIVFHPQFAVSLVNAITIISSGSAVHNEGAAADDDDVEMT
jgi:hypothetical protein